MNSIAFLSLKDITAKYADEIQAAVRRVVDVGWYLQGAENERFEKNYADFIGTDYCIGCGNGLDALIWIYRAYIELGIMQPGDEVIVPANTFFASVLAITENGLKAAGINPKLPLWIKLLHYYLRKMQSFSNKRTVKFVDKIFKLIISLAVYPIKRLEKL